MHWSAIQDLRDTAQRLRNELHAVRALAHPLGHRAAAAASWTPKINSSSPLHLIFSVLPRFHNTLGYADTAAVGIQVGIGKLCACLAAIPAILGRPSCSVGKASLSAVFRVPGLVSRVPGPRLGRRAISVAGRAFLFVDGILLNIGSALGIIGTAGLALPKRAAPALQVVFMQFVALRKRAEVGGGGGDNRDHQAKHAPCGYAAGAPIAFVQNENDGLHTTTYHLVQACALVSQLQHWIAGCGGPAWDLILMDPATVGRYLAKHGQFMYDTIMGSCHDFDETINAVMAANRALRHWLDAAWDISFTWEHIAPGSNHQAMPEALLLASVSLALAWGWIDVAGCLLLGFFGMVRPFDFLRLRYQDLAPQAVMSRQLTSENAEEAAHGLLRAGLHPEPPEQRLEGYLHLTGLIGACAAVLLVASVVLHWPHSGALEPTTQRDRLHGCWRVHRRSGATATEDVPGELRGAVLGAASAVPPPRTLQLPFIEEVPMLSDQDDGAKPEGGDPPAGDGLEPPQGAPPPADPPGAAAAQRQADAASGGAPEFPAGGGPAAGAAVAEGAVEAVSEPRAAASPPEAEAEARAATAPPEPGPLEAAGADGEPPGEACEVFPGWRFGYPGPWSELSIAGVAYGCVVEDWFACLAMCEQELACKQVVFMKLSSTCYATSDPGFEDTDGIGGHNFGFVSAHCRVTTSTSSTTRTRTSSTTTTLTTTTGTRTSTTITTSTSTTTTTTLTTTSRTTSTSTFTETTSTTSTTRTATWTGSLLNAIPSVLGPVVPAATAAAVDSDEWPQGPPGGGSMFCFAVFAPWTVEPALLESQGAARTGIFACDDCAMYSNPAPQIVAGMQVELIDMDMHVPKGGRWNTYLNAPMFSVVWDLVIKDGRWRRHDWVVKAWGMLGSLPDYLSCPGLLDLLAGPRSLFPPSLIICLGLGSELEYSQEFSRLADHRMTVFAFQLHNTLKVTLESSLRSAFAADLSAAKGRTSRNLSVLDAFGDLIMSCRMPWIIQADFQKVAGTLEDCEWTDHEMRDMEHLFSRLADFDRLAVARKRFASQW
ncbi:unnamed protein product [Prorocentrum cordatum]|uniref:Apple domain-containing protein n=1 Tax=Prorocentrum cordatum TaxID=2364126 RepID=A0ABN9PMH3_9DINO|nr:unnamed protein product [Polarella glacialis]